MNHSPQSSHPPLSLIEGARESNLPGRHRKGAAGRAVFIASTVFGILALLVLLVTIVNGAFGYAAMRTRVNPAALTAGATPLENLSPPELIAILEDNLRSNRLKTLEKEKPLAERSTQELYTLVIAEIVKPEVIQTYSLFESLRTTPEAIYAQVSEKYPEAYVVYISWLNSDFISSPQASEALYAGVSTAILGSLIIILITMLFALPVGIGAAIYLQEYAADSGLNRLIQTNINNLAGVPSIIYGMLGLAIFVRGLSALTGGVLFGYPGADPNNGRTILSAGLTMALLILPVIIINAQEAIKAVPNSLRDAAYGLGATQWQTVWHHVLPNALPGILTGAILSISRAMGETAPLVIIGASTYITFNPDSIFSKFTTLPIQIYQWTSRPQDEFRNIAAAAIIILLILLLALNATAILLRNRYTRRLP